jgi:hypothetical protein
MYWHGRTGGSDSESWQTSHRDTAMLPVNIAIISICHLVASRCMSIEPRVLSSEMLLFSKQLIRCASLTHAVLPASMYIPAITIANESFSKSPTTLQ